MPQFNDYECSSSIPLHTVTEQTKIFFLICFEPDSVTYTMGGHLSTPGPAGSLTVPRVHIRKVTHYAIFWELMSGLGKSMEGA